MKGNTFRLILYVLWVELASLHLWAVYWFICTSPAAARIDRSISPKMVAQGSFKLLDRLVVENLYKTLQERWQHISQSAFKKVL
jgi:hypothetical protein